MREHKVIKLFNYETLKKYDTVYIVEPQTIILDEQGNEYITKPYQKASVFNVWEKDKIHLDVIIYGETYCLPFPKNEITNSVLLSEIDYKKMKMTEQKVWNSMKKHLSDIDLLNNPSDEMLQLKHLILNHIQ